MKAIKTSTLTPEEIETVSKLPSMALWEIADVIGQNWRKVGKKVYFGAVPYLEAMASMNSIDENYGLDSGKSIVIYFLCNAQTWKGPVAQAVKAELKKRAGIK